MSESLHGGRDSGGGFALRIGTSNLKPVGELGNERDLRRLVVSIESSPALLWCAEAAYVTHDQSQAHDGAPARGRAARIA